MLFVGTVAELVSMFLLTVLSFVKTIFQSLSNVIFPFSETSFVGSVLYFFSPLWNQFEKYIVYLCVCVGLIH